MNTNRINPPTSWTDTWVNPQRPPWSGYSAGDPSPYTPSSYRPTSIQNSQSQSWLPANSSYRNPMSSSIPRRPAAPYAPNSDSTYPTHPPHLLFHSNDHTNPRPKASGYHGTSYSGTAPPTGTDTQTLQYKNPTTPTTGTNPTSRDKQWPNSYKSSIRFETPSRTTELTEDSTGVPTSRDRMSMPSKRYSSPPPPSMRGTPSVRELLRAGSSSDDSD